MFLNCSKARIPAIHLRVGGRASSLLLERSSHNFDRYGRQQSGIRIMPLKIRYVGEIGRQGIPPIFAAIFAIGMDGAVRAIAPIGQWSAEG
jgi:hypothetical protein